MPALLTRMSSPPNAATTPSTSCVRGRRARRCRRRHPSAASGRARRGSRRRLRPHARRRGRRRRPVPPRRRTGAPSPAPSRWPRRSRSPLPGDRPGQLAEAGRGGVAGRLVARVGHRRDRQRSRSGRRPIEGDQRDPTRPSPTPPAKARRSTWSTTAPSTWTSSSASMPGRGEDRDRRGPSMDRTWRPATSSSSRSRRSVGPWERGEAAADVPNFTNAEAFFQTSTVVER